MFVLNHLLAKSSEYDFPICIVFFDDDKAFDNIKHNSLLIAMKIKEKDDYYMKFLAETNKERTAAGINTFANPTRIPIKKRVN